MSNKQINFIGWIFLSSPRLDLSSPPSEAFGRWWDRYFFGCLLGLFDSVLSTRRLNVDGASRRYMSSAERLT